MNPNTFEVIIFNRYLYIGGVGDGTDTGLAQQELGAGRGRRVVGWREGERCDRDTRPGS